jgi:tyrosine aminotransferase
VEAGAKRLAQVTLGASHLVQCAIPAVLQPKDIMGMSEWKKGLTNTLKHQALFLCGRLTESCHGLTAFCPQGAMYALVKIDVSQFDKNVIYDDMSFMKHLLEEENVFVLPGRAFGMIPSPKQPCYVFRVVYCAPQEILEQAVIRIANFCQLHATTKS